MANESNDKNFKNELTKKIQDSIRNSFDKNIGGKNGTENPRMREFERNVGGMVDDHQKTASDAANRYRDNRNRAYNKESKKDEKGNRENYLRRLNDVSPHRSDVRPQSAEGLKRGLASDRARIQGSEARRAEAQRIKKESVKEAEETMKKTKKEIDKKVDRDLKSPKIKAYKKNVKAKIASRILGEAAYSLSQRMAARANAGGAGAIIIMVFTLFLASVTDLIDILGELGATALIVSVVGSGLGLVIGGVLWMFNLFCAITITMFWVLVLGGGHKKYFWKRVIRTIFVLLFVEAIPYIDILPFSVLMVCWNWHDFAKDKKKAKDDLKAFNSEFNKNRKIDPKHIKEYA